MKISWFEPLKEFPMYGINREGMVVRFPLTKLNRSGKVKKQPVRFLSFRNKKYVEIVLRPNYKGFTRMQHRLLAQAFIPNPENKSQVNHINGDKYDNRLDNLEWLTGLENVRHAINLGLGRYAKGKGV